MSRNHRLLGSDRVKQSHHVTNKVEQSILVDGFRPVGAAVTAHVRRNSAKAGSRKGGKLMAPRVPGFRKAVT